MGIVSTLWNWIYQLVVRSHILYYLYPVLRPRYMNYVFHSADSCNHLIKDAKGKTIRACKVDGHVYPCWRVTRVKTYPDIAIRDDDVILCGYPKTGAHWVHEIINMLVRGKAELTTYAKGMEGMLDLLPDFLIDSLPSPRVLNTHYYFENLPKQVHAKKNKIVWTVRNPKDVVVSYYNHTVSLDFYEYDGELNDYFNLWMDGQTEYESYFDYVLSWDKHLKNQTTNEILLVDYDDMKANPEEHVRIIAKFLGVDISDQFVKEVSDLCSFEAMQKKRSSDDYNRRLFRKGQVGDWKNWLSDEQSAAIDKVWRERMAGCTYQPKYN